MNTSAWFSGWDAIIRTIAVGACAYVSLIVLLRTSGKRTLSKLNAFDLVVTVALGSTLASILTTRDLALAQGLTAFAVLIGLQFVVSIVASRWPPFRALVTSEPRLLAYRGRLLLDALRAERVDEAEVLAAVRSSGRTSLADVDAAVLESDGSVSVMSRAHDSDDSALAPVRGARRGAGDGDPGG